MSRRGPVGELRALERLLASIDGENPARIERHCEAIASWPALLGLAEQHGVLAIVERAIRRSRFAPPADVGLELRRRAAALRLAQSQLAAVCDEVLAALDSAGVPAVALKGPVLGERLHGDPTLRVATDVDVMVALNQVPASLVALERLGYRAAPVSVARLRAGFNHHLALHRQDSPAVELHYRLSSNFGVATPSEALLARSLEYRTGSGVVCRVLSHEDELVYLAIHAAAHLFARLGWLLDVKMLLDCRPAPDWQIALLRAREQRVGRAFAFAMSQIAGRMDLDLPAGALPPRSRRPCPGAAELLAASRSLSSTFFNRCFRTALCDSPTIAAADFSRRTAALVRRRLGLG